MIWTRRRQQRKKRRKQPQRRRMHAPGVIAMPRARVKVSQTKRRRKRRQRGRRVRSAATAVRQFIWSARWVSLGLLALTIYAIVQIGLDERFYLTRIPVDGVASVPPSEIVDVSGLAGQHIFAADPVEAAAQIADIPGIISATVTLAWPNQVGISIREDAPVAVWLQDDEAFWVNEHGRVYPARGEYLPGLLTIESEAPGQEAADEIRSTAVIADPLVALTEEARAAQAALEAEQRRRDPYAGLPMQFVPDEVLKGALTLVELQPNVGRLHYRPSEGLSYEDGRGWRVAVGVGTDMTQKLAVYEALVADLESRGIQPEFISVSNQAKPFYRIDVPDVVEEDSDQ